MLDRIRRNIAGFSLHDHVDIKAYFLMFAGFFLLTCIIVFFIVFSSLRNQRIAEESLAEQRAFESSLNLSQETLRVGDFLLPEQVKSRRTTPYLQREPKREWDSEEIQKYWIELEDTGVDKISEHNHQLIESLLEEVP